MTKLLSAVPEIIQGRNAAIPLADFATGDRQVMLTLHVLYPNEFLPALDLLDRRLVTRLIVSNERRDETQEAPSNIKASKADGAISEDGLVVYYVRSAQQQRAGRFATSYDATTNYEVRLTAWNCSCPAFAFAAFPSSFEPATATSEPGPHSRTYDKASTVGGIYGRSDDVPVCKHILACILAERCSLFTDFVEERRVSNAEYAGWAAGWGG